MKPGIAGVVTTPGVYKGQTLEAGEIIVAVTSRQAAAIRTATSRSCSTILNGAVTGPASAVDGNIACFDQTTGKVVKDSGLKNGRCAGRGGVGPEGLEQGRRPPCRMSCRKICMTAAC